VLVVSIEWKVASSYLPTIEAEAVKHGIDVQELINRAVSEYLARETKE